MLAELHAKLDDVPAAWAERLRGLVDKAVAFARAVAADAAQEADARRATSTLYHVASAVTLAWEGVQIHAANGDARRLLLSKLVVEHRLHTPDPFALSGAGEAMAAALLDDAPVPLATALDLLG